MAAFQPPVTVFWQYTTPRVLTAEWIDGVPFHNIPELQRQGFSVPNVMSIVVSLFAYQIFRTGFVHW